jgi:hypothetical protein
MPGFIIGESTEAGRGIGFMRLSSPNREYYTNFFWDVTSILDFEIINQKGYEHLLALKDCKLPNISIEEEKIMGSFSEYKFAKKVSYDDVSITWYDSTGMITAVNYWMSLMFNNTSGIGFADDYKRSTKIRSYTSDGSMGQTYELVQSWPKTVKFSDLSYTSSDIKTVEVSLSYDYSIVTQNQR